MNQIYKDAECLECKRNAICEGKPAKVSCLHFLRKPNVEKNTKKEQSKECDILKGLKNE